jgi:glc operon protein GlcG
MRRSFRPAVMLAALALSAQHASAQLAEKGAHLGRAQKMVAAAQAGAERNQLAGVIAVVDDDGWPILLLRMDGAAFVASESSRPARPEPRLCSRSRVI